MYRDKPTVRVWRQGNLMPNYKRASFPGGYYFFTVVSYKRRIFLTSELARDCLRHAIRIVRKKRPFDMIALCLLPEHLHCIWKLPRGDADFSTRWSVLKGVFTREFLAGGAKAGRQTRSRKRKREAGVWQRRFWEHQLRDERDLQRHMDYIHYNPVKHGLVAKVDDWPWSTYHRYHRQGWYGNTAAFVRLNDEESLICAGE